jgi:hypothetical protein
MDSAVEEEHGPTMVPGHGGEGRVDDTIPGRFNVEEERGVSMEVYTENAEEGAWWRQMWRRSGRW